MLDILVNPYRDPCKAERRRKENFSNRAGQCLGCQCDSVVRCYRAHVCTELFFFSLASVFTGLHVVFWSLEKSNWPMDQTGVMDLCGVCVGVEHRSIHRWHTQDVVMFLDVGIVG